MPLIRPAHRGLSGADALKLSSESLTCVVQSGSALKAAPAKEPLMVPACGGAVVLAPA